MDDLFNPHFVYSGIFIPNYLLSTSKISHGAKLLYRILVERTDNQGEALASVPHLAQIIADREGCVIEFLNELEKARYLKIHWHPLDRRSFRCFFLRPSWIKRNKQQRKSNRVSRTDHQKPIPCSRYSEEVCREYALACQAAGQKIRKLEAFITYLRYSGAQDKEIDQHLAQQNKADGGNSPIN